MSAPREGQRLTQGFRWEGDDPEMLAAVLDAAFDYRGDVTLFLVAGGEVQGYLANRNQRALEPYVEIFPSAEKERWRLPYAAIRGIAFTGKDTAAGKSWETWVKQYRAKKEAEGRGETRDSVGLRHLSLAGEPAGEPRVPRDPGASSLSGTAG